MNYLKTKTENKIKDLRSKKVDNSETECSFQPKLTDKAKNMGKRTVDNLYVCLISKSRIGKLKKTKFLLRKSRRNI